MTSRLRGRLSAVWRWLFDEWRWFTLGLGLAVGLGFGWWAGSIASCATEGCAFSLDVFGVVGTWLGGVGTVVALGAAVVTLRNDLDARDEEARRANASQRRREKKEQADASRMTFAVRKGWNDGTNLRQVYIHVSNQTAKTMAYRISVVSTLIEPHGQVPELRGSRMETFVADVNDGPAGVVFADTADELVRIAESCEVIFEMHDQVWKKGSDGPARRVEDDDAS